VIRLAAVTLPGADDLSISKTWSYAASSDTTSMYGVEGAATARPVARWRSRSAPVDAPPGVLYLLGLIGRGYRASSPAFDDSAYLTAAIKLVTLLLDAATCAFVWALARRFAGDAFAGVAAIGYWLNPATLMNGAVLGYLDPWMTAPALAALLAADAGMAFVAGAALAAALLVQVHAAIVAPLVALLLWHAAKKRWQSAALTAAGFALVACAALAPFVVRGALPGIARAVVSPIRGELTSVSAANLWWVVSWLLRAAHNPKDLAHWGAWRITVRAEPISRIASLGVPDPQWMALAIVGLCGLWALYRAQAAIARGATPAVIVAAGAFTVHAYFALAMGLHANQLFLAIPLLAVSAAALPQLRGMVAAISGIAALNLFLFDGVGRGFPLPPRHLTIVDATLLLAAVNVVVLVRHAAALSATCESSGRYDRASPGGWG
jgi:hypothetical protein